MPSYLQRRGPVYYTRLAVPERLRSVIGQRDLGRSLGTKDLKEAKRLLPGWLAEAQARIDAAEEQLAELEAQGQEARRNARRAIKEHLQAKLRGSTAEMPPELAAFRDIQRELEEELSLERARRRVARDTKREEAKETGAPKARTISSMFHGYSSQEGMKPSTVAQFRSIIGNLTDFLGHNDATCVTHADIIHWLEHLRTEPIRRGKAAGKPRSAQTINESYLAAVKAVFAFGRQALMIDENPLREVKPIRSAKRQRLRDPDFTQAERETILLALWSPSPGTIPSNARSPGAGFHGSVRTQARG